MDEQTMQMLDGMTARVAHHVTRAMGRHHLDDVRQVAYLTALEAMPRVEAGRPAERFLAIAALRKCSNYLTAACAPVHGSDGGRARKALRETFAVSYEEPRYPRSGRDEKSDGDRAVHSSKGMGAPRAAGKDPVIVWADGGPSPFDMVEAIEADDLRERVRAAVERALLEFSARDAAILRRLCALGDRDSDRPSHAEVGREFGLSKPRVQQLWARLLRRLRADVVLRELSTD